METPHPRLLIFATSLVCSAGMALPISGFPNLAAANQEDELGQRCALSSAAGMLETSEADSSLARSRRYLYPSDFYRNGVPASIGATAVIITIGYAVMRLLGL